MVTQKVRLGSSKRLVAREAAFLVAEKGGCAVCADPPQTVSITECCPPVATPTGRAYEPTCHGPCPIVAGPPVLASPQCCDQ